MKKIYLDAGHGKGKRNGRADSGAVNSKQGLIEADINLRITKYIQKHLEDNYTGFQIMQTRTNDDFYTLMERSVKANNWGADIFVSCHVNAGGGTGYESFVYPAPSKAAVALQNVINAEAVATAKRYGLGAHGNQPAKRDNLSVLRETVAPAVLTEICYLDSNDYKLLKNEQFVKDMSIAYATGIAKFLGLGKKSTNTKPAPSPSAGSNVGKFVVVTYDGKEGLNIRSKPDFTSSIEYVAHEGEAFTIVEELAQHYKIKSGLYITKSTAYVTVK